MQAGFLNLDITPTEPLPLAGFAARQGRFTRIDTPLEANLAAFVDRNGQPIVLGSVDTLFIGSSVHRAIADVAGLPAHRLILMATHTHNAPSLAPDIPRLGRYDPAYGDMVITRVGQAVQQLISLPKTPLFMGRARRHAPFNVNRRRPAWVLDYSALRREGRLLFGKVIAMAPYHKGAVDPTLCCIVMRDRASAVRAVIWSFPCHANRYPYPDRLSSDFPGLVRDRLRDRFGKECCVLYLPGFAGSAVPDIPFSAPRTLRELAGRMLPFNPVLPSFTPERYRQWSEALTQTALACIADTTIRSSDSNVMAEDNTAPTCRSVRSPAVFTAPDGIADICLDMVHLDFAQGCGVIAMTGEMVGEWWPILQPLLPEGHIATGYLAGPCLYVPTDQLVREGGYEADRFRNLFDLPGNFVTGLVPLVQHSLARLSDKTQVPADEKALSLRS